jgi:hypothetical protein
MNRYYGLDRTLRSLDSHYPSDIEPDWNSFGHTSEPDWEHLERFVTGDVPNFRTLWYWWYFQHTADLKLVRERFEYLKGAFLHQRLQDHSFLAEYCYDETYGIGPIAGMRTGHSADNTFLALAAARALARFAEMLDRDDADWLERYAHEIANAIQKQFWIEERGYYAMRIKPDGSRDDTPLSVGLLRPMWIGELLLQTDDEKSRAIQSVSYVFDQMYSQNGFVRLIPSHHQTATMTIGYLLKALKRMDHPGLDRAFCDLPKWADPSGTFGEYLDDRDGPVQCYEHLAHRNRIWESGINSEALMFAMTGFEPSAATNQVTFAPYLPNHWPRTTGFETSNLLVGDRRMSLGQSREPSSDGLSYTVVVRHESEGALRVTLRLRTEKPTTIVGPERSWPAETWAKNQFGVYIASLTFETHAGEEVVITY